MLLEDSLLFPSYKGLKGGTLEWLMAALFHNLFRDLGSFQSPFCHSWAMTLVHIAQDGSICFAGSMTEERQKRGGTKGV